MPFRISARNTRTSTSATRSSSATSPSTPAPATTGRARRTSPAPSLPIRSFPTSCRRSATPATTRSLEWNGFSPRVGLTYAFGKDKRPGPRQLQPLHQPARVERRRRVESVLSRPVPLLLLGRSERRSNVQRNEIDFDSGVYSFANIDPEQHRCRLLAGTRRLRHEAAQDERAHRRRAVRADARIRGRRRTTLTATARISSGTSSRRLAAPATSTPARTTSWPAPTPARCRTDSLQRAVLHASRRGVPGPSTTSSRTGKDYSQTYQDLELTAIKRMSNNWMMRANVTLSDWTQHVGPGAIIDPSPLLSNSTNSFDSCSVCDGARWRPAAESATTTSTPDGPTASRASTSCLADRSVPLSTAGRDI